MNTDTTLPKLDLARFSGPETVIEPKPGWRFVNVRELWEYRDLFYFLVWRDIKARYAQSVLGIGWAVIQPVFTMIVFTIIFGKLAKIGSDGVPYAIFSFTALVPWIYFSNSLTESTGSLISASNMLGKVYFPRLIIPITPLVSKLVDFGIAFLLLLGLMAWFKTIPTIWVLTLPLLIMLMMLTAAGLGMWLTALAIQYRDIKYGMNFAMRLLMYAAPVVYPASLIPQKYRLLYGLNPMAGVIEGFRAALLGSRPMPWDLITVGSIMAIVFAFTGALYFRRMERIFADVV
jgi:lipopolysaccharide transport system permease protein